jgi:ferrochelatase
MKTGVLLMAHGSPERVEDVAAYLRGILTRRPPSPELIAEFEERFRRIGGGSPLLRITRAQAAGLERTLGLPVHVGMRHWTPTIAQAVEEARRAGVERLVGLALAPQYAALSVGGYHAELQKTGMPCALVRNWHLEPALLDYWREATRGREFVLFTAHSIPVEGAEPYPAQLAEMVGAIARGPHALAYQSRSPSPVPWLGPEVPEVLRALRGRVSVAPIGFVSEHVEILYDLDILHRGQAEALGLAWERLPMPNDDPRLVEALASAARKLL